MRDHNGERGPVPTDYRAHDWQTCRVLRQLADFYGVKIHARRAAQIAATMNVSRNQQVSVTTRPRTRSQKSSAWSMSPCQRSVMPRA